MLSLSAAAIIEKNKLYTDGVWLVLLKITVAGLSDPIRLVRNTENITWNNQTWVGFPFDLDEQTEDGKGEIPSLVVRVGNVTRTIQYYVEQHNGFLGSTVTLYVVHSKHLDLTIPELEETFEIVDVKTDALWVYFTLGPGYPLRSRRPQRRILKNFCPFEYGGVECGILDVVRNRYPTCNRTLIDCRQRGNSARYGGEPSMPTGGFYV